MTDWLTDSLISTKILNYKISFEKQAYLLKLNFS